MTYLYISLGAVAGAITRYQLGVWITQWRGDTTGFPLATFVINVTGSLLLGFLMRYLTGVPAGREVRAMLTTGFCGAYTTFSTFSYETVNLMVETQTTTAFAYVGASMVAAPTACFVGYLLAGLLL